MGPYQSVWLDLLLCPATILPSPLMSVPTWIFQISVCINWKYHAVLSSVAYLRTGHTVRLTFEGLLGFESGRRSRSKDMSSWGWAVGLKEHQQHLARQLPQDGLLWFLWAKLGSAFWVGKRAASTGKEDAEGGKSSVSPASPGLPCPHNNVQDPVPSQTTLLSWQKVPHEAEDSVCFVIWLLVAWDSELGFQKSQPCGYRRCSFLSGMTRTLWVNWCWVWAGNFRPWVHPFLFLLFLVHLGAASQSHQPSYFYSTVKYMVTQNLALYKYLIRISNDILYLLGHSTALTISASLSLELGLLMPLNTVQLENQFQRPQPNSENLCLRFYPPIYVCYI